MPWAASFLLLVALSGQDVPFAKDIAAFKEADRAHPPAPGQTLFIGSSSFTIWKDAQSYFPKHHILNRAYGGSRLLDLIRTVDDIVTPYKPKQVVVYCGENDFGGDPHLAAYAVVDRFKKLHTLIRQRLPHVPITYVSMKPSPSRYLLRAKFKMANQWIREFCESQANTDFVDITGVMVDSQGRPKREIFQKDLLHMNAQGYKLWAPLIEAHLK